MNKFIVSTSTPFLKRQRICKLDEMKIKRKLFSDSDLTTGTETSTGDQLVSDIKRILAGTTLNNTHILFHQLKSK